MGDAPEPDYIVKYVKSIAGGGTGFAILRVRDEQENLVTLGDQLQDFIVEELAALGRSPSGPNVLTTPTPTPSPLT